MDAKKKSWKPLVRRVGDPIRVDEPIMQNDFNPRGGGIRRPRGHRSRGIFYHGPVRGNLVPSRYRGCTRRIQMKHQGPARGNLVPSRYRGCTRGIQMSHQGLPISNSSVKRVHFSDQMGQLSTSAHQCGLPTRTVFFDTTIGQPSTSAHQCDLPTRTVFFDTTIVPQSHSTSSIDQPSTSRGRIMDESAHQVRPQSDTFREDSIDLREVISATNFTKRQPQRPFVEQRMEPCSQWNKFASLPLPLAGQCTSRNERSFSKSGYQIPILRSRCDIIRKESLDNELDAYMAMAKQERKGLPMVLPAAASRASATGLQSDRKPSLPAVQQVVESVPLSKKPRFETPTSPSRRSTVQSESLNNETNERLAKGKLEEVLHGSAIASPAAGSQIILSKSGCAKASDDEIQTIDSSQINKQDDGIATPIAEETAPHPKEIVLVDDINPLYKALKELELSTISVDHGDDPMDVPMEGEPAAVPRNQDSSVAPMGRQSDNDLVDSIDLFLSEDIDFD